MMTLFKHHQNKARELERVAKHLFSSFFIYLLMKLLLPVVTLFLSFAPAHSATITVNGNAETVAVDGAVTLREAITSINGGANVNADVVAVGIYGINDTINFSIGSGLQTISPATSLPDITQTMLIDGFTQPGSSFD